MLLRIDSCQEQLNTPCYETMPLVPKLCFKCHASPPKLKTSCNSPNSYVLAKLRNSPMKILPNNDCQRNWKTHLFHSYGFISLNNGHVVLTLTFLKCFATFSSQLVTKLTISHLHLASRPIEEPLIFKQHISFWDQSCTFWSLPQTLLTKHKRTQL